MLLDVTGPALLRQIDVLQYTQNYHLLKLKTAYLYPQIKRPQQEQQDRRYQRFESGRY